ncbi:hypothetical protein [Butyricimonas virosa]|uniref:hypothetical protein n=1 Tax=Butyricimonas virosa TaxID=544645 RepID=UPI00216B49BC|nr:hypothetical protein [Butyricimonas virosa]
MKKTYDRKVFKRKLLSDRRTVTVTIRLFMILLLFFPLLTRAGTVDSTRVGNREVREKWWTRISCQYPESRYVWEERRWEQPRTWTGSLNCSFRQTRPR